MKVLADENIDDSFVEIAKVALAGDGILLSSVALMEWRQSENGALQALAVDHGFDVMFTFDKAMADQTQPVLPVLVFDRGVVKLPTFHAVLADVLVAREYDEPDYYPVMVPDMVPGFVLRKIAAGLYAQNPRDGLTGSGFLKTQWDERDPRPPVEARIEEMKRNALRGQERLLAGTTRARPNGRGR